MFVSVDVATENCLLILLCRQAYACPDNYCKECRRAMSNARYRRSLPANNPLRYPVIFLGGLYPSYVSYSECFEGGARKRAPASGNAYAKQVI